ncbi:MAG TPA: hypothetical protein VFS08_15150 [Gemmatimonadaceae bacterium]|nr:hypothetical protein [Gemmatimonadaceae bacterium]
MTVSRILLLAALAPLVACAPATQAPAGGTPAAPAAPTTARELVARMRGDWEGRWYRTLEFRQLNTVFASAGEQESEWIERQRVPKLLRIDFIAPQPNGSGIIFRNDSVYTFDAGALARSAEQLHPLLLMSADVYALPVDSTVAALGRLAIDTTQLRRDTWESRPVYVVGAPAGDSTTSQFWVDAERMLLVRLVHRQTAPTGRTVSTDYRFSYQDVDGFAVPSEILFVRGGRPFYRERYVDVRPNAPVDDAVFDPALWAQGVPPS